MSGQIGWLIEQGWRVVFEPYDATYVQCRLIPPEGDPVFSQGSTARIAFTVAYTAATAVRARKETM